MKSTSKLSKDATNAIGLYLAGVIVLGAGLYFFVVSPSLSSAKQANTDKTLVKGEITALENLEEATEELRINYESVREQRDAILSLFPSEDEVEKLLITVSEYATLAKVNLSKLTPEGGSSGGGGLGYETYPFTLTVSGTYGAYDDEAREGLLGFLKLLEEGVRFVDPTGLNFDTGTSGGSTIEGTITINAYYSSSSLEDEEASFDEEVLPE